PLVPPAFGRRAGPTPSAPTSSSHHAQCGGHSPTRRCPALLPTPVWVGGHAKEVLRLAHRHVVQHRIGETVTQRGIKPQVRQIGRIIRERGYYVELRFFHHLHLLFGWWFRLQLKDHRYVWLGTPSKSAGPTHTTFGFAVIMRALSSATVTPVDRVQRGVGWKEKCN